MKKLIVYLIAVFAIVSTGFAQSNSQASLFGDNELSLSLKTGYVHGQDYKLNLTAGAEYFLTRNFGVYGSVPFYLENSASVRSAEAGVLARLPLDLTIPFVKKQVAAAPYLGTITAYDWQNETWQYGAKGGLEVRLNKGWSIFAEGDYRFHDWSNVKSGGFGASGGIKLLL